MTELISNHIIQWLHSTYQHQSKRVQYRDNPEMKNVTGAANEWRTVRLS